jgi:hypothetical protein
LAGSIRYRAYPTPVNIWMSCWSYDRVYKA